MTSLSFTFLFSKRITYLPHLFPRLPIPNGSGESSLRVTGQADGQSEAGSSKGQGQPPYASQAPKQLSPPKGIQSHNPTGRSSTKATSPHPPTLPDSHA